MLLSDTLEIRLSEIREALNRLLHTSDRTDEQTAEMAVLSTEALQKEPEYRAAKVADDLLTKTTTITADPEVRERLALQGQARFGRFLASAISGRALDGAEAEYRSAVGVGDGIPLDLFEQDRPRALEYRADAATVAPATAQGENVAALQPFVFSESIAPRLGIDMPTVPSGSHTEARISVALTAAPKAKGVVQDSTAATIIGVTAAPRRIATRLTTQIEDVASFGNDTYETSLRENARSVLGDAYDAQVITGTGVAPIVEGLISQLTDPATPTDIATWDLIVAAAASGIDGKWASTLRDIRLVVNPATYKLSAATFRGTDGDMSAASHLTAQLGSFSTNSRMPAKVSNVARGIIFRAGRPGIRTAVHPTWGEVVVDDIYTDAAKGQRHFTISVMVGSKVLVVQPAAYDLIELKISA